MSLEVPLGVVSWNVDCHASPISQYSQLEKLENRLRSRGAKLILFCLSEVTSPVTTSPLVKPRKTTLAEIMTKEGQYVLESRPTSYFRDNERSEDLAFASRDIYLHSAVEEAKFVTTRVHRAHWYKPNNLHRYLQRERRVGKVVIDGLEVFITHASPHSPPRSERMAIFTTAGGVVNDHEKILIGDFNTAFNKFVWEAASFGWHKLTDPKKRATWGCFELDHAFVSSPALAARCEFEIGPRHPSDHNALEVVVWP